MTLLCAICTATGRGEREATPGEGIPLCAECRAQTEVRVAFRAMGRMPPTGAEILAALGTVSEAMQ